MLSGTNGFDASMIRYYRGHLEFASKMQDPEEAQVEREDAQRQLERAEKAIPQLELFLADIKNDWEHPKKRIIGHVILSPPLILSVGKDHFTQDFAVIEVDTTTIDASNFVGNIIDLGTEMFSNYFIRNQAIMVFKRGYTSGLTVGCLNNVRQSFAKPSRPSLMNIRWSLRCCLSCPNLACSQKVETLVRLSSVAGVPLLVC